MDLLHFRLPGAEKSVRKTGAFSPVVDGKEPNGFVVSDFLHQRLYTFKESHEDVFNCFHESTSKPPVISKRDYQIESQAMLHAFPVMQVEKAVYSRVKAVAFNLNYAERLFEILEQTYPNALVYLISSEHFGTWIGASPELLLKQKGMQIETVALAGTQLLNENRKWTRKEELEHQFVTEHIVETLERNQCVEINVNGPYSVDSGPITHLKTDISAFLSAPNAWLLAMDLHPTPAVCGTPRMSALDLLLSREMHERDLYAGVIGIKNEKSSQLYVNLRCAQLFDKQAFLYVGGGYTIDSIPDLEWEETENKAQTLEKWMNLLMA